MPETLRLQSVSGPDVGGWELASEGGTRKLRIIFRRNITDQTQLTIEAFLDAKVQEPTTAITLPEITPLEVSNEIGQIAIFAGEQFSIRAEQLESLAQIDTDRFATLLPVTRPAAAPRLAYRFSKRPYALTLRATRQEPQAHVIALHAAFVTSRKQQLTTRFRYELTGAPRSSLSIALPNEFVLLDVQASYMRDWYSSNQNGQARLTIELSEPRLGTIEFDVNGFVPRESNLATIQFPQPLDATRLDSTAALWLDEGLSAVLDSSEGWRSIDASQVDAGLRAVRTQQPAQFAFASSHVAPAALTLRLTPATPKISADSLSMVTVTDLSVVYTLALQWQINAARTETLTLTTPKWLAGKLEFQGEGIRETTFADAGGDLTRWTIYLRTPISGKYFATAIAALSAPTTEVQSPAIRFEREQVPINPQRHFVLLINSSSGQLNAVDASATAPVQPDDLPIVVQRELLNQATELVQINSKALAPKWTVHKFDQQAAIPASVNLADLTTVVSRDGTYRAQAIYTIKNRTRQFLAVRLPEKTELLSVYVAGQPSRAVTTQLASANGATVQLIALPKTSAASLSFPVKLVWSGRLPHALPTSTRLTREELDIPAPQVIGQTEDPEFGIPVARTRWTVYLPSDLEANASRSVKAHNLSLTEDTDRLYGQAIVQETSELLEFLAQTLVSTYPSRENQKQIALAKSNLKHLEQALNQYQSSTDATFQKDKAEVLSRISDVNRQIDENQRAARDRLSGLGNPALTNSRLEDVSEGDLIANEQRSSLILSNGGIGITIPKGQPEPEFDFRLGQIVTDDSELQNRLSGKKSSPNQESKNENRARLRITNESKIDDLNAAVTTNNSVRLQSRDLQQRQRGIAGNGLITNTDSVRPNAENGVRSNVDGSDKNVFSQGRILSADPFGEMPAASPQPGSNQESQFELFSNSTLFGVRPSDGAERDRKEGRQMIAQQAADRNGHPARVDRGPAFAPPSAKGLSLEIDLPSSGQKLIFSKVGGDPKLSLLLRSHTALHSGISFVWSLIWLAVGGFVLMTLRSPLAKNRLKRAFPFVAAGVGMMGVCTLPMPLSLPAFLTMLIGVVLVARHAHQKRTGERV